MLDLIGKGGVDHQAFPHLILVLEDINCEILSGMTTPSAS